MLAYHNDQAVKDKYLGRIVEHQKADHLVQGYGYWQGGKGCAVGCTIHGSNHQAYETEMGIPEMLARLEDTIFEGLATNLAREWPARFLSAVRPGSDLSLVGYKFMYWNLTENLVLKDSDDKKVQAAIVQCRAAIKQCADAICPLTKGEKIDESARSAAESAAESARSAAESARSAAESAAESARSAAWSAAWSAAYKKMADKLIELIEEAA